MNNEQSDNRLNSSDINDENREVSTEEQPQTEDLGQESIELSNSDQEKTSDIDREIDTISNEIGNPGINEEPGTDSSEEEQVAPIADSPTESLETNLESDASKEEETDSSLNEQSEKNPDSIRESTVETSDAEPVVIEEGNLGEDVSEGQEAMSTTDGETDFNLNDEIQSSSSALKKTKDPSDKEKLALLQEEMEKLQTETEGLQTQVAAKDKQIEELTEEVANKENQLKYKDQEIEELKEQINNPELIFINKKLQQQAIDLEEDQKELASYFEQAQKWATRNQALQEGINSAIENGNILLSQSRETKEKLPEALRSQLQKRQEGLELIGKMLGRLQAQTNANTDEPTELPQLPTANKQELIALLDTEATGELQQKAIAKKLKEVSTQRWQIISRVRDTAEKRRKNWLNIIDKKILPILDGINDGKKFSANLLEDWKTNNPGCEEDLDAWFSTYGELGKMLLETLEAVKVYPMAVEIGKQIDYNRHEPFDVQPDENLQNEDIKEVTRQGYEYEAEADQGLLVLRSAQVMVVKND